MSKRYTIPIDNVSSDFERHLSIEDNNNILFSGKFGLGKTYFLQEFFEKGSNEYLAYHLFPVNYQISSNEDIVNLLKYDLLIEISKNKDIFNGNKLEDFIDLQNLCYLFANNNKSEILKNIALYIPKVGRPLKETITLFERLNDFKNDIENGEKGLIEDFLKEMKKNPINENDNISKLINDKILGHNSK